MAVTFKGLEARKRAIVEATKKPTIIRHITKPMLRRLKVQYSAYPTRITNLERENIRTWMINVLQSPTLSGNQFPKPAKAIVLYAEGKPLYFQPGTWQNDNTNSLYLAQHSTLIPPLERVAILATLARLTQLNDDPEVMEAVCTATCKSIKAVVTPVWDGLVIAEERPSSLAFNLQTYEVAAEMQGKWYLPSGQPVKVDKTWTVMEY